MIPKQARRRMLEDLKQIRHRLDDIGPTDLAKDPELDEALTKLARDLDAKRWSTHMVGKARTP